MAGKLLFAAQAADTEKFAPRMVLERECSADQWTRVCHEVYGYAKEGMAEYREWRKKNNAGLVERHVIMWLPLVENGVHISGKIECTNIAATDCWQKKLVGVIEHALASEASQVSVNYPRVSRRGRGRGNMGQS